MNQLITLLITMPMLMTPESNVFAQDNIPKKIDWSCAATLPDVKEGEKNPGVAGPVAGISNNVLVVAGGANFPDGMPWEGASKVYQDEIFLFYLKKGSVFPGKVSKQKLPCPIAYCASVNTPKGIVYLGGENEKGISENVIRIEYSGVSGEISFTDLRPLPLPLTNPSAVLHNNKIYIAGGDSKEGTSDKFFSLDLSARDTNWQVLPEIPVKLAYAVMVVQSNGTGDCIYLMGGRCKNTNGISDIYNSVFQFDIDKNKWKKKQSLPHKQSAGTGIATGSSDILLFSGDTGEVFSQVETFNLAINNEKDETKKRLLIKEKVALLNSHPGFIKEVLRYNTITDTWSKWGAIPFKAPVTTTAIKWGENFIIPSGEIKAGVRTTQILEGRLK